MNTADKILQEFRERYLMKDSECTWETYPEPEDIEQFIKEALSRVREETMWQAVRLAQKFDQEMLADVLVQELGYNKLPDFCHCHSEKYKNAADDVKMKPVGCEHCQKG